jgi:hypothetical protein
MCLALRATQKTWFFEGPLHFMQSYFAKSEGPAKTLFFIGL